MCQDRGRQRVGYRIAGLHAGLSKLDGVAPPLQADLPHHGLAGRRRYVIKLGVEGVECQERRPLVRGGKERAPIALPVTAFHKLGRGFVLKQGLFALGRLILTHSGNKAAKNWRFSAIRIL